MNKIQKAYSYNEIGLVPRIISSLEHRLDADISVNFCGVKLSVPLIASPMPDVCNGIMAGALAKFGAMGIIHRFQTIEQEIYEYELALLESGLSVSSKMIQPIGVAVGITGDYQERFEKLYSSGCRIFCLDTANGASHRVASAIDWIQKSFLYAYIIAGNVATREAFKYLANLNVHAIRVGIAGGSACITRTETGVYYPMASSVIECAEEAAKMYNPPVLIADGGVQLPADLAKALALGADVVMAGSIFAGTKESPGGVIKDKEERLHKLYRGAASFAVQKEHTGEEPAYNEGGETLVPYKPGGVEKVIHRFSGGLRSSFSYMDAKNLKQFQENSDFVII